MLGAIAGDIIGSPYEVHNLKSTRFPLFREESRYTDDTVLTVATADAILSDEGYAENYKEYQGMYPNAGYGPMDVAAARTALEQRTDIADWSLLGFTANETLAGRPVVSIVTNRSVRLLTSLSRLNGSVPTVSSTAFGIPSWSRSVFQSP